MLREKHGMRSQRSLSLSEAPERWVGLSKLEVDEGGLVTWALLHFDPETDGLIGFTQRACIFVPMVRRRLRGHHLFLAEGSTERVASGDRCVMRG